MPLNTEQLQLALRVALEGGDALTRLDTRVAASLDEIRARAQARDMARMAGKPGASPGVVGALRVRATRTRELADAGRRATYRSWVPRFEMSPDRAGLHGLTLDASGAPLVELRVIARDESGQTAAEARTDLRGYFRLLVPPSPIQGGDPRILLEVYRGDTTLYRDPDPYQLHMSYSHYRELVLTTASQHIATHG